MTDSFSHFPRVLIVIPCLNEVAHIESVLDQLTGSVARLGATVAVADGGSRDGTRELVAELAHSSQWLHFVDNPGRLQSAGINKVVREHGDAFDFLIRVDAHGIYPEDYCDRLVEEAFATGADAVVVSMLTSGSGLFQSAAAIAQNSKLGNGGSAHRSATMGQWVEHGHHALMSVRSFLAIGGYDETFSHNEDAEFDFRLRQAGGRIWLTSATQMTYLPRATLPTLFAQYLKYGRGRARNVLKHRIVPRVRQMIPLLVAPSVLLAALSPIHWVAAVPMLLWMLVCLGFGMAAGIAAKRPEHFLAGISVMVMHLAWSLGFWQQLVASTMVPTRPRHG
jgi:GT2 family glycosyltransferase